MIMKILLHIENSPSKARRRRTSVVCSKLTYIIYIKKAAHISNTLNGIFHYFEF